MGFFEIGLGDFRLFKKADVFKLALFKTGKSMGNKWAETWDLKKVLR